MSKRKPDVYLKDILESIEYIQRFLDGVSEDEFYENVRNRMLFFGDWKLSGKP